MAIASFCGMDTKLAFTESCFPASVLFVCLRNCAWHVSMCVPCECDKSWRCYLDHVDLRFTSLLERNVVGRRVVSCDRGQKGATRAQILVAFRRSPACE